MDKSTRLYIKALDLYHKGNINKALEFCELSISDNLKNSAALNLKGLLLYLKGELDSAKVFWSINKDINKDGVAKKYLADVKEDENRKQLYEAAILLISEIKIKEAVELLQDCHKSDFNTINVNNALAECFIKQGEYRQAKACVDKVLDIDKSNKEAINNKKMMVDFGFIEEKASKKRKSVISICGATLLLLLIVGIVKVTNKKNFVPKNYGINITAAFNPLRLGRIQKVDSNKESDKSGITEYEVQKDKVDKNGILSDNSSKHMIKGEEDKTENNNNSAAHSIGKNTQTAEQKDEDFPTEQLTAFLDRNDYDGLYAIIEDWKEKVLGANESQLYTKAENILKRDGVAAFYRRGTILFDKGDFDGAKNEYIKAYNYSDRHYLKSHIIFMLASSYEKIKEEEKSLKFFEEYATNYMNGNYIAAVYYRLTLIYRSSNIDRAKYYAQKIQTEHPEVIYNNSIVHEIIRR